MKKKSPLLFLLGILSIYLVFRMQKPGDLSLIFTLNPLYLGLALGSFLLYLLMEAISFKVLLSSFGTKLSLFSCYRQALADFYCSSLTPGGSGGQPGQLYAMNQQGVPAGVGIASLLSFNTLYHMVMLLIAVAAIGLGVTEKVMGLPGLKLLLFYGGLAQLVMVIYYLLFIFSNRLLPKLLHVVIKLYSFFRKKEDPKLLEEKFHQQMDLFHCCALHLKRRPLVLLQVCGLLVLLFFFSYLPSFLLYKGLGLNGVSILEMLALQSVAVLALESVPLPGALGVAETSLFAIYALVMPTDAAFVLMALTRITSLYFGVALGGLSTLILFGEEKRRPLKVSKKLYATKQDLAA